MKRFIQFVIAAFVATAVANEANGQVTTLVVGNQVSFNALDGYDATTGQYLGFGYGLGTGAPGTFYFTFGPTGNVFLSRSVPGAGVLQYDGMTGAFVNTFVSDAGGFFTFGPDSNLYRMNSTGDGVLRYDGASGALLGTFVAPGQGVNGGGTLRFGPGADLFMADGNHIKRFNGTTGTLIGQFTPAGAGGLGNILDFLFTSDGRLLVSGTTGSPNDRILQFDASSGGFLGNFAQGSGLNVPFGMAIGPDSALYVASTSGHSIKRFDLANGNFLGDFVATTAHPGPTYIEFPPFPVPEPSSIILLGLIAVSSARFLRTRVGILGLESKQPM
jgi:hypothetical protein